MGDSLNSVLEQSSSVLVMLPTKPYFDQVAAGLSLYLALRDRKDVQVVSSAPMTVEFNRLIGVNKISQELGNKNLVIKFVDYKANDIERVSYDIEDGEFRLTVIPKEKLSPPAKENIDLMYMGVSADSVILIGGGNETHFPMLSSKDLVGTKLIHIGIRDISLSQDKNVISLARPASSISEVVGNLLKESSIGFDEDVATNLVMGLEDATNNLTDQNVTADTFALIADLMRAGGRRNARAGVRSSDFPPGAIPGAMPRMQQAAWQQQGVPQQVPQRMPQQARQQPSVQDEDQQIEAEEQSSSAPQDWLEPKIFKGTSVK
jgi:hypothetical protein